MKKICIDVGNTSVAFGLFEDKNLLKRFVFLTDIHKTHDEYRLLIKEQIKDADIIPNEVERIIYSSVVPEVNDALKAAFLSIFENAKMILIGKGTKTGIALKVDNPNEIGNDLIADLVGAKEKYGYPALVVDLGTASKILLLDKDGYFASALIMPGLKLSIQSLVQKASLLPAISLEIPESILAKNTVEAMNAGVVFGHVDMILGLIKRIESEIGYECKHILTGGYSLPLIELLKGNFIYDMNLNLDGLNIIIDKNGGNK